jgi:hypothetical protein
MMSNSKEIKNELMNRLKNLSETVVDSFGEMSKGGSVFVESTVQQSRMSTCLSCEDFNSKTTQCRRCGCFMSAKTRLKAGSCPIGKWGREP